MRPVLYVFARAPRLGTVKRRLAAGIGTLAALCWYRAMLARTLRRLASDRRFRTVLAVTPDRARVPRPRNVAMVGQGHGDLGARMARALSRHRRGRVAIVGCDIPGLTADDVARAFRLLRRAPACLGPAADGGYWLVAVGGRRPARPFASVRWSGPHALADTLANFRRHPATLLRPLRDVDRAGDLPGRRA